MEPVAVWVRKNGEWALIHRCRICGKLSSNRVAADDNPMKLMAIAMKPLCEPPFPVERIEELTAQIDKLRQEVKLCRYIRKRTQAVLQPDRPHSNPEGPEAGAAEPAKKEKQEKHKEFEI